MCLAVAGLLQACAGPYYAGSRVEISGHVNPAVAARISGSVTASARTRCVRGVASEGRSASVSTWTVPKQHYRDPDEVRVETRVVGDVRCN